MSYCIAKIVENLYKSQAYLRIIESFHFKYISYMLMCLNYIHCHCRHSFTAICAGLAMWNIWILIAERTPLWLNVCFYNWYIFSSSPGLDACSHSRWFKDAVPKLINIWNGIRLASPIMLKKWYFGCVNFSTILCNPARPSVVSFEIQNLQKYLGITSA